MSRPSRRVVRPVVAPTPVPLAFVLPPVVAAFAPLPDPRVERTKRHALLDIVAITLCAVLAGAETWVDIAAFGHARLAPEAARLGAVVRRHWGIENRCHWTLDVSFHEDACRVRTDHAPANLALVRKVALALLRQDRTHKHGLTSKRLRAGWDHDYLQTVLRGARPD